MMILKKIGNVIIGAIALPFVLLMRILYPFVIVRICVWDLSRIGHILPHFDMYVSRRDSRVDDSRNFDICCFKRGKVVNYQIKKMVERAIPTYPLAFWVDKVNKRLPGWEKHVVPESNRLNSDLDSKIPPHISFTQKEHESGKEELKKLGISDNHPFICFHAREASYLNTHQPEVNWDYHSYRNADICNYIPAAEKLASKGYFAIRMGRHVEGAVKTNNPRIIDYATNHRTDFLDMYLSAHCCFFLAGSDGLAYVPTVFRRPVVWIDYIPLSAVFIPTIEHMFIPKKLWSLKENRMLTFDEILNSEVAKYCTTEAYQKAGIKVIDNSAEEIIDVAMEMEERLQGTWKETEEDKELQQRFLKIVGNIKECKTFGLIGAKFLRAHKGLLGLPAREPSVF
ncbi:MAG: TIGR04372 family glycosyltransferase [Candidatus Omnitrophica bacterium]|nr:TIGR04372 family glycosyltransferase [Candidatus Omnitrophota bacterium]